MQNDLRRGTIRRHDRRRAELAKSIASADVLAAQFRDDNAEIAVLFDLVGVILRAEAERPGTLQ